MAKPFRATDEQRKHVEGMAAIGIPHKDIAGVLGIGESTLEKYFVHELQVGPAKANTKVAQFLFTQATQNLTAAIFWAKTRMRWRETDRLEVTAADGKPFTAVIEFAVAKHKLNGKADASTEAAFQDYLSLPAPKAAAGNDNEGD